ncbi:MAG: type II toxin-antitoxin system VapB family antitoxin [Acidobacteriota bacterium]|nr:type II toxin-antitoxin system VapB family antitoxin [Acidobacteriota bacterium]
MPLNIKDAETHALAKRIANLTGESLTKTVKHALEARLEQLEILKGTTSRVEELDHIALQCANLPRRDQRSADEIIGYDASGLPT